MWGGVQDKMGLCQYGRPEGMSQRKESDFISLLVLFCDELGNQIWQKKNSLDHQPHSTQPATSCPVPMPWSQAAASNCGQGCGGRLCVYTQPPVSLFLMQDQQPPERKGPASHSLPSCPSQPDAPEAELMPLQRKAPVPFPTP